MNGTCIGCGEYKMIDENNTCRQCFHYSKDEKIRNIVDNLPLPPITLRDI